MPRVVPAGTSLPLLQLPDSNTRGSWNEEIHRIKQLHAAAVRVQAAARARSVRSRSLAHITQLADSAVRGTATLASNLSTNVQHGASSVQQRMQSCAAGQSVRSTMKAIRDVMRTVDAKLEEYEDEADEQLKQVAKLDMFAPCLLQVASLLAHCTAHISRATHFLLTHTHTLLASCTTRQCGRRSRWSLQSSKRAWRKQSSLHTCPGTSSASMSSSSEVTKLNLPTPSPALHPYPFIPIARVSSTSYPSPRPTFPCRHLAARRRVH